MIRLFAAAAAAVAVACSNGSTPTSNPSPSASATATFEASAAPSPSPSLAATPGASAGVATPTPTSAATREPAAPLPAAVAGALRDAATVRELPAPPSLSVKVIPRSELPALLDRLITAHDRDLLAKTTTLYRLLGHFSDQQDYLSLYLSFGATGILGLYSPADDELWVVSDSGAAGLEKLSRSERETLAHELIHAIQDYHFSLDATYSEVEDDLDRSLAFTAVIEGDAVTHEERYSERFLAVPFAGRAFLLGTPLAQAGTIPPSFIRELLFPYTTGASWVKALRERGGVQAIDAYLKSPPSSTAVVLHPDLETEGFQPAVATLPDLATSLGTGWSRESGGTMGEFQWRNYLQLALSSSTASAAAAGWTGDHYDVYTGGGASAAAFEIRFATGAEATEFADSHSRFLASRAKETANEGPVHIVRMAENRFTATTGAEGTVVRFAIATTREAAVTAIRAITGS